MARKAIETRQPEILSAMCLRESDYELTRGLAGEQIMYNGGTSIAEEQQSTELKIQITINFAATLRLSQQPIVLH